MCSSFIMFRINKTSLRLAFRKDELQYYIYNTEYMLHTSFLTRSVDAYVVRSCIHWHCKYLLIPFNYISEDLKLPFHIICEAAGAKIFQKFPVSDDETSAFSWVACPLSMSGSNTFFFAVELLTVDTSKNWSSMCSNHTSTVANLRKWKVLLFTHRKCVNYFCFLCFIQFVLVYDGAFCTDRVHHMDKQSCAMCMRELRSTRFVSIFTFIICIIECSYDFVKCETVHDNDDDDD